MTKRRVLYTSLPERLKEVYRNASAAAPVRMSPEVMVRMVARDYANGLPVSEISRRYGVDEAIVSETVTLGGRP